MEGGKLLSHRLIDNMIDSSTEGLTSFFTVSCVNTFLARRARSKRNDKQWRRDRRGRSPLPHNVPR